MGQSVRMLELQRLLAEHLATPFPSGVVKGRDYGCVDPVMIGADIYGWASRVSKGEALTSVDRDRLRLARDDLYGRWPHSQRPHVRTTSSSSASARRRSASRHGPCGSATDLPDLASRRSVPTIRQARVRGSKPVCVKRRVRGREEAARRRRA